MRMFSIQSLKNLKPHHFAAIQYAVLAIFLWACWLLLLTPTELALGQLNFMFDSNNENQMYFVVFASAPFFATALSIAFCFRRASAAPLANVLAIVALACFGVAYYLGNQLLGIQFPITLGFGMGAGFAVYSALFTNIQNIRKNRAATRL